MFGALPDPAPCTRGSLTPRVQAPTSQDKRSLNEDFLIALSSGKRQSSPEHSRGAPRRHVAMTRRDNTEDNVRFRVATAFVQTERATFCRWSCNNSLRLNARAAFNRPRLAAIRAAAPLTAGRSGHHDEHFRARLASVKTLAALDPATLGWRS